MVRQVRVNAQQLTERWKTGMQNGVRNYEAGIDAVTENPCAKAAAQVEVWAQRTVAARSKWARNVGSVTIDTWKSRAKTKGSAALLNSIEPATSKVLANGEKLITAINTGLKTIPPRGATLEANMQRSLHMARTLQQAFR